MDATITNTTISGNTADRKGGGMYITAAASPTVAINNSTITANTALEGGGVFAYGNIFDINSSVISGNTATNKGLRFMLITAARSTPTAPMFLPTQALLTYRLSTGSLPPATSMHRPAIKTSP
ncbi:MAG: hypothetical protein R3C44_24315 [Chloroflexota bacterium]